MQPYAPPRQREVRVFVSSTFQDMQEEREELVKQIFPQLRRMCESRGVTWGEVDLRWGITDEAAAEGSVLPICLAEIDRCRPYFIGLLGERYGWVPEKIPAELVEAQPWLGRHADHSVTALEILHGVLLNPAIEDCAYFYFRDPQQSASGAGVVEEDPARRERLEALKRDIRERFPAVENFTSAGELGKQVLRDLTSVIERRFPNSETPNPLDRAAADHEAYADSRRRVYIGRREYMERLDAHASGEGPPLVVLGESGGGKSALLANWVHHLREEHGETPILVHFLGASPESADWMALLRRLLGELERTFEIPVEIPDRPEALRAAFGNALYMAAARGRVVLVLDALNQIEDRDGAPDLVWLRPRIPANVRLVVSTLPGRTLDALRGFGWPTLEVAPLETGEREELIVSYLKQFAKELSPGRRGRIAAASQAANGLYLTTLLNELRLFGSHQELDQRLDWYLQAGDPFQLFGKVLERWEQDYEAGPDSQRIVRESLSRLWAARHGLSETELLEAMGGPGSPAPHAAWSPLSLAAGDAIVNRGGLLSFTHEFLRAAVRERYLPTVAGQQTAHRTLARYFDARPPGPRKLDELPWQWQEAGEWQRLAERLARPRFFDALWRKSQFDVKAYWARIESESPLRMEQVYAATIDQPAADPEHAWLIGSLLADSSRWKAARRVREPLVGIYRDRGDSHNLASALTALAMILRAVGDLDGAMKLMKELEQLCNKSGETSSLHLALGGQAVILQARGELDAALALHQEEEGHCRQRGDRKGLANSLGNQATILKIRGDLAGAMALMKEQERLCQELGHKDGLQRALNNQAMVLLERGDLAGSMALLKRQEEACREIGQKDGLSNAIGNQSLILRTRGDLDGAMALMKEHERLCRELGNKNGLQTALGNQGSILQVRGDLDGAMALHKEKERLCRELGNKDGLRGALGNQALVLKTRGDLEGAMALHKEEERLCREVGSKDGISISLGNQALILWARREPDAALALMKEQERLCREMGRKDGLQFSLGNQAMILKARGDLDGAMALRREQERLCRELGNKSGLRHALGGQAMILRERRDLQGALALHSDEERLCRELRDPRGLATSLKSQSELLACIPGRKSDARRLASEALAIANRHGFEKLIAAIRRLLDLMGPEENAGESGGNRPE